MAALGSSACGDTRSARALTDAAEVADAADADAADADAAEVADAADADADAADAGVPWIGGTAGRVFTTFRVSGSGEGTNRLHALSLTDDAATFALAGIAYRGVAYRVSESFGGYDVFAVLAIAADGSDLAMVYLYCRGDQLTYAFSETFNLPLVSEELTGRCDATLTPFFLADVSLPALGNGVQPLDTGTSINGPGLALSGARGTISLRDESWELLPFGTVDCSSCPGGPWYEVHAMLHRPSEGCFAILYLFPDRPHEVQIANVLCLPSLEQPAVTFDAAWQRAPPSASP